MFIFQEYKYLSEPYSEDIDQDAARRLLEFGDDYRKYIDSDGASSFSGVPHRGRRTPPHRRLRSLAPSGPRDLDSDSDLDDLHHVIDQSRSQLTVTENVLKKYSSEAGLGLDYVSIVATCTHYQRCFIWRKIMCSWLIFILIAYCTALLCVNNWMATLMFSALLKKKTL